MPSIFNIQHIKRNCDIYNKTVKFSCNKGIYNAIKELTLRKCFLLNLKRDECFSLIEEIFGN